MIDEQIGEPGGAAAEVLITDLKTLRKTTRAQRHTFWFPLLIFGLLVCGSMPLYSAATARMTPVGSGHLLIHTYSGWLSIFGGLWPYSGRPEATGISWLVALPVGAGLTGAWYGRHARITGLRTKVAMSLAAWVGAAIVLVAASFISLHWVLDSFQLAGNGKTALLAIALGLIVLAWLERSALLGAISIVYAAAAAFANTYDPVKLPFFRAIGDGNSSDNSTANVLLPGLVLVVAAAVAFMVDQRKK